MIKKKVTKKEEERIKLLISLVPFYFSGQTFRGTIKLSNKMPSTITTEPRPSIKWKRKDMSRDMTKPTTWLCAQRRLRSAWVSDSSLCAHWVAKDTSFLHADSEDSGQTGRMPRLIWVFAGRTLTLLVLSCRGSITMYKSPFFNCRDLYRPVCLFC